jgi:hypothetical protein
MRFAVNQNITSDALTYYNVGGARMTLTPDLLTEAVVNTNEEIKLQFRDAVRYKVPLLLNVPLKNLSGAVGECFGQHVALLCGTVEKNPCEAGAPDFLPIVESSKQWFTAPTKAYYDLGGFDTKASFCKNRHFTCVTASSHHNQTSTVLVVQWAYDVNEVPEVIGIFYTNALTRDDWKLSLGKPGSKTTNAAALTASGTDKLRRGWVVLDESVVLPRHGNVREQYGLTF